MTDQAALRRMRLLEELLGDGSAREIDDLAGRLGVDDRTIRRDVAALQELLAGVQGIALRRGRVHAAREGYAPGYFTDQLAHQRAEKEAIADAVVRSLGENLAIALTAGSTTYLVAREIRRATLAEQRPHNLIAFTNSLPALLELAAAGISTGAIGEVYNADDCAFHSHEFRSAFQASVAIVGASGVVPNPSAGAIDLFSHRAEEASFLKQLLAPIPEILIAVDATKVGRRHPWSFTSAGVLAGKSVCLFTSRLDDAHRDLLERLVASAHRSGLQFAYQETGPAA
ncbi:MAG: DeoR/GlpR transcriptional regulator [Chthonomonadales bacterium]|nr:DeoR/GlpR transcriptional regulator [Chthonomonadales bacterium]